ncbi:dehydrogenase/reductase SDR family member 4-like isoform X1 [Ranitomeya imitator]|uniref:dehydrogenase/reductase SDR family member 4-like isoform X1 n=1 Tax=Ranitomeya imitator TaxID=111125 RepID=UPI0037E9B63E
MAGITSPIRISLAMHSEMEIKPCNESKKKLHEKVAIVTGSTYGIGFAIARRLAQDGAHVLICSRKKENVEKAAEQLKDEGLSIYAMQCHVGNKEDRERLVAKALEVYGKIDILVCNAAVNPFVGPIFDTTEEMWTKQCCERVWHLHWRKTHLFHNLMDYTPMKKKTQIFYVHIHIDANEVFHINVISTFFMIKLVAPHIEKQGGGSIILCSSFIGYIPHPTIGAYAISKTTIFGLTNVLAQAMRFMNVRVNGLALGLINTSFSEAVLKNPELASLVIPMGVYRFGEPEECAGIASFLCSEDASYINGENIGVTGGLRGRL